LLLPHADAWVWRYDDYVARESFGRVAKFPVAAIALGLKKWDLRAAQQPTTTSQFASRGQRIKQVYGREAFVIPPPIDVDRFQMSATVDDYYLVLSRLVPTSESIWPSKLASVLTGGC